MPDPFDPINADVHTSEAAPALSPTEQDNKASATQNFDPDAYPTDRVSSTTVLQDGRVERISRWWKSHRYLNVWWWETICCTIALAALIAIVATIRVHEKKPLPKWRYGLTVNAIIAAYTVVL
jgi:hypothetical protein